MQLNFNSTNSHDVHDYSDSVLLNDRQMVLGLQCTLDWFSRKGRRDGNLDRSQSVEIFFLFSGDDNQVQVKKRKKR